MKKKTTKKPKQPSAAKPAVPADYLPTKSKQFDENGHRLVRNPEMRERKFDRAHQWNPNNFRFSVLCDVTLMAKVRQYLRGKEGAAVAIGGRNIRKPTRALTISMVVSEYLTALTKDIVLDKESLAWRDATLKAQTEKRQRVDAMVAAGVNRIPKDQQLKRGNGAKNNPKAPH